MTYTVRRYDAFGDVVNGYVRRTRARAAQAVMDAVHDSFTEQGIACPERQLDALISAREAFDSACDGHVVQVGRERVSFDADGITAP